MLPSGPNKKVRQREDAYPVCGIVSIGPGDAIVLEGASGELFPAVVGANDAIACTS